MERVQCGLGPLMGFSVRAEGLESRVWGLGVQFFLALGLEIASRFQFGFESTVIPRT